MNYNNRSHIGCAVALPIQSNCATQDPAPATNNLLALSMKILTRNQSNQQNNSDVIKQWPYKKNKPICSASSLMSPMQIELEQLIQKVANFYSFSVTDTNEMLADMLQYAPIEAALECFRDINVQIDQLKTDNNRGHI